MAISKDLKIRIKEDTATLSEKLYIYQNDRGIELFFSILNLNYSFRSDKYNFLRSFGGVRAGATILKPNKESLFVNILDIVGDSVKFIITQDLTDELDEVGEYVIQFHLYDEDDNRVTIPPISFEVKALIGLVGEN